MNSDNPGVAMKALMKVSTAVAGLMIVSGAASAADLGYKKPTAVPTMALYNWNGFYIGAALGGRFGNDYTREFVTATGAATGFRRNISPDGFFGGLYGGYNYQMNGLVLGIEGDIDYGNYRGAYSLANGNGTRTRTDFAGSIRGRLGYLVTDRVLLYATGGLAVGNIKHTYFNTGLNRVESFTRAQAGWTIGGGVEAAVTRNILVRAEYRYTDYGRVSNNSTAAFNGFTYRHNPRDHQFKVGVAYKF